MKQTKKGRVISPAGQKFLDNIAYKIYKTPKVQKEERLRIVTFTERAEPQKKEKGKFRKKEEKSEEIPLVEKVKKQK